MEIKITTAASNDYNIAVTDDDLLAHFSDRNNCTEIILRQINEEKIYQSIFADETDLTIVDIGANIGIFSVYATGSAKKIYSVEPTPSHFAKLKVFTAPFSDIITPLNFAVGSEDGTMDFYVSPENPTQNSLISNWRSTDEEKITVQARTLKSLLDEQKIEHVDLIKCDIEGGEMFALTEERIAEVADRVDCWYVETHQTDNTIEHGESVRQNLAALTDAFTKNRYEVQQVNFDTLWIWKE